MTNKYGIYQSSSRSCIFYKEDDDGNQSTFNIFVKPKKENPQKEEIFAFIDNEQMKVANWSPHDVNDIKDVKDVLHAFSGWATDAPLMFEIEAHKSMSHCLSPLIKKEEND
ncbi:MAG: hypothetical protein BV456_07530 [Thermoplasmata archaeon M8B2D]|nr:MAG: hypothetical protein BV456_07530 [Thermoplasmata archaeon M8B2D]